MSMKPTFATAATHPGITSIATALQTMAFAPTSKGYGEQHNGTSSNSYACGVNINRCWANLDINVMKVNNGCCPYCKFYTSKFSSLKNLLFFKIKKLISSHKTFYFQNKKFMCQQTKNMSFEIFLRQPNKLFILFGFQAFKTMFSIYFITQFLHSRTFYQSKEKYSSKRWANCFQFVTKLALTSTRTCLFFLT